METRDVAQGVVAEFDWWTTGGRVNCDLYGDGGGRKITYEKGRGSTGEIG